ncbi:MAG: hypothetical protein MH472_06405 [Bacteroidia bacterium]|nr:hypothetical protein [Bacteroidia bacterium]
MENNIRLMENRASRNLSSIPLSMVYKLVQAIVIIGLLLMVSSSSVLAQTVPSKIHPSDTANSQEFKNNQGGNRLQIFHKLENLIKPANTFDGPAPAYDYYIGDYKISSEDLIFLLGEPDNKIAPTVWQYYLSADQSCRVIIGIDENGMVSYLAYKGC